ncbi:Chromogranin [Hirschfeldia incana]|nr:Chromogranin [Hirschfeldia incana]KAJ0232959.1 Chromogranin [Hirschfeldia incana]
MSASPANMKSLHGFSSPLTRGPQVSAISDVDPKSPPSAEKPAVPNRTVASRSSRQPRLSFSTFPPSSEHDHPKKVKSDENPPRKEEAPVSAAEEEEEDEKRPWNLRPRKACGGGSKKGNGAVPPAAEPCGGGGGASEAAKNQKPVVEAKSNRQRGIPAESPGLGIGGGVEAKIENHRLWVALSRDEIEEDVFSMSGNRPARRPRKRAKTLQKHLDVIFPGLCLVGMNADCFRVATSPAKR